MAKKKPNNASSMTDDEPIESLALSAILTPAQIAILRNLARLGIATEKDLSSMVQGGPKYKTIGYHVRKLERMGLLKKAETKFSARNKPRVITDKGREVLRCVDRRNRKLLDVYRLLSKDGEGTEAD